MKERERGSAGIIASLRDTGVVLSSVKPVILRIREAVPKRVSLPTLGDGMHNWGGCP
jgi:hypothetical protein